MGARGLKLFISNKCPGDGDAVGQRTTLSSKSPHVPDPTAGPRPLSSSFSGEWSKHPDHLLPDLRVKFSRDRAQEPDLLKHPR